ncbi:methyltransferase family protein [Mesorhizobium sp. B2-8-5]|uniref:methyltransferase family protein n=1 Tax=Mesorhizobium sp. B2-8-5 TaxID=2589903 RepID=UPI00112BF4D8|nr:isoprenylcysteine carboxylmethyltransferase family protein [Mesorhizobium sp. B2-8-5]UCI24325.1 isoprenylcysteine carboxylmethyltransferase family protein [Mesorhizobium sp. B2-8-5]
MIAVAGMALLVWARQILGRNWSQTVSAKQNHNLVRSGPYRSLRHPMYTGGLLACLGSAIVVGGPFVFLFILLGRFSSGVSAPRTGFWRGNFPMNSPTMRAARTRLSHSHGSLLAAKDAALSVALDN